MAPNCVTKEKALFVAQLTPSRNKKRAINRHTLLRMLKVKDKKILKAAKEKQCITIIRLIADISGEVRRQWLTYSMFKTSSQLRIL